MGSRDGQFAKKAPSREIVSKRSYLLAWILSRYSTNQRGYLYGCNAEKI